LQYLWLGLSFGAALFWVLNTIDFATGIPRLKRLEQVRPLEDADCPSVSILFAARDEAENLPGALETLLALDYPRYEVVAVNDRSEDATQEILEAAARKDARLKVVKVTSLPEGWLGKPHALQQGYEQSTGDWLVFTDADVHFAPDLLRRTMRLVKEQQWDHLTLLGHVEMHNLGEKIAMPFIAMAFLLGIRPWRVSDAKSQFYAGIGAFQQVPRTSYEAMGTHRRLAMAVVDDMKLGWLMKNAGFRSGVANSGGLVSLRWYEGVGNLVRGTTKNLFAASGFRLWASFAQVVFIMLLFLYPLFAVIFAEGWTRAFAAIALGLAVLTQAGVLHEFKLPPVYGLTSPIGAAIFIWMIVRSTVVTLWDGGITWRGTFYPLEELRRGAA